MSAGGAEDTTFSRHMEAVACKLLGAPNKALSTPGEMRFGSHGSLSIDLERGVWTDHEAKTGGGVLDLLKREKGLEVGEAIEWLKRECGAEFEDRREQKRSAGSSQPKRIVATYDYVDEDGELLFQTVRYDPKDFRQRRPDPTSRDGWAWSVKGVRQVPYRLHDVLLAKKAGAPIFIVEGEKDADALAREGLVGTCNAMGAGKWPDELTDFFVGADVVILPDNDEAGRNHAAVVGSALAGKATRLRVLDLPDLPPKGDASDWLNSGGDGVELIRLCEAHAQPWAIKPPESRFGAVPWSGLDSALEAYRYPWLVKGLMYQGDRAMVFGESGSGKSFLVLDFALSIARGAPFMGMKVAQGAVLYQAGEGGKGLLRRMDAYRTENRVVGDLPFVLLPKKINLFAADGDIEPFILECVAWKAALPQPLRAVVIDTFSTASTGANENASEDMGRMLDAGDRIADATGAAVIWVHHKNAAGERERGHSSFRANIETAIEVTHDEDTGYREFKLKKLKDGEGGLKFAFKLKPVEIGTDDDGDPITSCVVGPAQVGSEQTGKRPYLPSGQFKFIKVLDDAIRQKGGVVPIGGDADPGTYGVEYPHFRDLYLVLCGAGREPGAIRTALSRDGDALWRAGLIGRHNEWLWISKRGELFL